MKPRYIPNMGLMHRVPVPRARLRDTQPACVVGTLAQYNHGVPLTGVLGCGLWQLCRIACCFILRAGETGKADFIIKGGIFVMPVVLLCMARIGLVHAEIYKQIDADGHVTYSSAPMKGSKKLDMGPPPITLPPARMRNSDASPPDFPRVDSNTQKNRDDTRRKILEDELATEGKLLNEARQNLKDAKGNSEASSKKIKDLQEQVSLHEKNVDALKSELTNLK